MSFQAQGQVRLQARPGLINDGLLSRVLAQTGPLEDFCQLVAVVALCGNEPMRTAERHDGRPAPDQQERPQSLAQGAGQVVLPRVRKSDLYGPYYHGKKADGMGRPESDDGRGPQIPQTALGPGPFGAGLCPTPGVLLRFTVPRRSPTAGPSRLKPGPTQ